MPKQILKREPKERQFQFVAEGNRSTSPAGSTILLNFVIVVAVLYFARVVLIPLALALLLAFMLAPLTIALRRAGLGRAPSALIVVLLAFVLLGLIGLLMASQSGDLARRLPGYQQNIHKKLEALRTSGRGVISRVTRSFHNVSEELTPPAPPNKPQSGEQKPVPVEIRGQPFSPFDIVQKVLGSVLGILMTSVIVIVFVIFMLIQREDLRDRLIRLAGARRVNTTTKVLDDAAYRVSRYLLAQLVVNLGFGILAGLGLFFMGVPNPLLWALVAALLRYVPYLGIWIAAVMPAALCFAVDPAWWKVPAVFGLYFGIDLLMYNLAEPFLYGSSAGVSPMAILVAAVFWAWLWGPVGLLLATPLTVCVVVIGRNVPSLEFLSILFSDDPGLKPETRFYQRLLAMDADEATEIAEHFLKHKSLAEFYDEIMIPALTLAEMDRHQGRTDQTRQEFVLGNMRLLVEDLADRAEELREDEPSKKADENGAHANANQVAQTQSPSNKEESGPSGLSGASVFCLPARDEADEIAALMLAQLIRERGLEARTLPLQTVAGDFLKLPEGRKPSLASVLAVPPYGYTGARHVCRRLHERFPELKLVAVILSERDGEYPRQPKPGLPATQFATSLRRAVEAVLSEVGANAEASQAAMSRAAA